MHTVVPDAVWVRGADGTLTVIDLPAPSDENVAQLVRKVCHKMTVVVERWQAASRTGPARVHWLHPSTTPTTPTRWPRTRTNADAIIDRATTVSPRRGPS